MDDIVNYGPKWTWQENKQFENSLVEFPEDCPNRWERIAAKLGTKSAMEVEQHYAVLLADLEAIEAGLFDHLPEYTDDEDDIVNYGPKWTWQENKQFENGLIEFPEDCPNRWERIAAKLGTKSAMEVEHHYAVLLTYLEAIEAGLIDKLPEYPKV
ncbi:protein radialis-like 3 [Phtheirospermum japonicum]|uniref:Protein radialis-like 3 n=1 Tax=Phtheirospermum japonicum TaxID=374723 RepID=A0A830DJZ1_9LAMI|nr:protein radialis-like 3 [Phtheirospermum japonicum]